MASDGVWDAKQVSEELIFRLMRSKSLKCVAQRLMQTATKPLADDTTLFAIDVLPNSMVRQSPTPLAKPELHTLIDYTQCHCGGLRAFVWE